MDPLKARYRHGFWNRYFFSNLNTWLALPWTRLFVAAGLSPNQVTFLSAFVSLGGSILIAFEPDFWRGAALGTLLLMIGIWWDHSDGQVARITGKGSPAGALLDTVLDRWMEFAWVAALGIGVLRGHGPTLIDWPPWMVLAAAALAVHGTLYVRWSNIQKDLYLLRQEIQQSQMEDRPGHFVVEPRTKHHGRLSPVTTFYLPFSFNRDVTYWMLVAVTLCPAWVVGLAVFGALHGLRGLEKNWYTRGDMKRGDSAMVAALLDPDYHK